MRQCHSESATCAHGGVAECIILVEPRTGDGWSHVVDWCPHSVYSQFTQEVQTHIFETLMLTITASSSQNKNTQKHLSDTWHGMASLMIFSSLKQNFSCSVQGMVTMTAFLNSSSQEKEHSLFKDGQVTAQVKSS